jgi:hypothetical protein
MMEAWVLLGSFFVLILIGTPVAYAMGTKTTTVPFKATICPN